MFTYSNSTKTLHVTTRVPSDARVFAIGTPARLIRQRREVGTSIWHKSHYVYESETNHTNSLRNAYCPRRRMLRLVRARRQHRNLSCGLSTKTSRRLTKYYGHTMKAPCFRTRRVGTWTALSRSFKQCANVSNFTKCCPFIAGSSSERAPFPRCGPSPVAPPVYVAIQASGMRG